MDAVQCCLLVPWARPKYLKLRPNLSFEWKTAASPMVRLLGSVARALPKPQAREALIRPSTHVASCTKKLSNKYFILVVQIPL